MSFSNLQVSEDDLPTADAIDYSPMAENYEREVVVQGLITAGVIFLVSAVPPIMVVKPLALKWWLAAAPIAVLIVSALLIVIAVRRARSRGVAIRDHDIAFKSGLWFQRTVLLPFTRVQHAEVTAGPLQRKFGLASLKLYTAGGSAVDLNIPGLSRERAERLRDHILERGNADG